MNEGDLLKGYVYDLFGSVVVESAMDMIQESLKSEMERKGYKITNRYSPGYCGWTVDHQKKMFSLLQKNKLITPPIYATPSTTCIRI
ncbi:MAG: hypothetical protein Q8928_10665 [Bacteroidota bacterium]|nr:hypothetical protein [Bacteroidota bacterium]